MTEQALSDGASEAATVPRSPAPRVLVYHAIDMGSGRSSSPWAVSLGRFSAHLDRIDKLGLRCVSLKTLIDGKAPDAAIAITFDDGYADNLAAASLLSERGMTATWFIVSDAVGGSCTWEPPPLGGRSMLTVHNLIQMHELGMEIGAHGMTHSRLTELADDLQSVQIQGSRAALADMTGITPRYFAYPYGDFDEAIERKVALAGFEGACSTQSGSHRGAGERFRVRRLTIHGADTPSRFARKLILNDNTGRVSALARMKLKSTRKRLLSALGKR